MTEKTEQKQWCIDFFTPEDAPELVKLYRAVYGDNYPRREVYDPAELVRQLETGDTYRMIARTEDGEVVAHTAVYRSSPPNKDLYECGQTMVRPDYRQSWVALRLAKDSMLKLPTRYGMEQVWGEAVCNHLFTQQAALRQKFYETGLEIDLMPAETYNPDDEQAPTGRVSAVIIFKTYKPKPQTIFVPGVYDALLQDIYAAADCGHTLLAAMEPLPDDVLSAGELQMFPGASVARMTFAETGGDFAARLDELESQAEAAGIMVRQVFFKLTRPWTGAVVEILRQRGYFFGGALPRWFDDDGFLMQKIIGAPNFAGANVHSKTAQRIKEFIRQDWETVKGNIR